MSIMDYPSFREQLNKYLGSPKMVYAINDVGEQRRQQQQALREQDQLNVQNLTSALPSDITNRVLQQTIEAKERELLYQLKQKHSVPEIPPSAGSADELLYAKNATVDVLTSERTSMHAVDAASRKDFIEFQSEFLRNMKSTRLENMRIENRCALPSSRVLLTSDEYQRENDQMAQEIEKILAERETQIMQLEILKDQLQKEEAKLYKAKAYYDQVTGKIAGCKEQIDLVLPAK